MFEPINIKAQPLLVAGAGQPVNDAGGIINATLERGAVLASTVIASDAKAKKSITFTGTPVSGKEVVVTIDGNVVRYTTGSTTLATEVTGIKAAINEAAIGVTATSATGKLSIEVDEKGITGNSLKVSVEAGESGLVAGALAVETIGGLAGQEIFDAVDSGSGTAELQKPIAVLAEDAVQGECKRVIFTGCFWADALKFKAGQSLASFKKDLRKLGIFTKGSV